MTGRLTLNQLHAPTAYTLIDDVLRFCIHDLGVKPLSDDWHQRLEDSEEKFKQEFAPAGDRR